MRLKVNDKKLKDKIKWNNLFTLQKRLIEKWQKRGVDVLPFVELEHELDGINIIAKGLKLGLDPRPYSAYRGDGSLFWSLEMQYILNAMILGLDVNLFTKKYKAGYNERYLTYSEIRLISAIMLNNKFKRNPYFLKERIITIVNRQDLENHIEFEDMLWNYKINLLFKTNLLKTKIVLKKVKNFLKIKLKRKVE